MNKSRKKVMLIQPWNYHDEGIAFHDLSHEWRNGPYSLVVLATQLKVADIPVRIVDLQPILVKNRGSVQACLDYLRNALFEFRPDIIGVSFFSCQYKEVETIVKFSRDVCKNNNLDTIFIAGGIHASIEPRLTIEKLGFDYSFVGEAEDGIVKLACGAPPMDVEGIVSRDTTVIKPAIGRQDLNSLPFPDWSLCDYKFYSTPSYGKITGRCAKTLDLMMGRGCVYKCSFCAYPSLSRVRFYAAEYLVEQIKAMKNLYEIDSVYFIDSSIGNNRKLLEQFCNLMMKSGLSINVNWYANMRPNQVDEPLLRLMWRAGCRALLYGFESGSQRILDLMNKKCTVEDNIKTAELHNRLRFPYHASMIIGFPGEKEEDVYLSLDFVCKMRPPMVCFNLYVPLPGSPDYEKLKKQGQIQIEDPHEWRRIGESLPTGKIYADIPENRFRLLFNEAMILANKLREENRMVNWTGPDEVNSASSESHSDYVPKRTLEEDFKMLDTRQTEFIMRLRDKWREIPATRHGRVFSSEMLAWSDKKLLEFWEECKEQTSVPEVRGWYQDVYKDMFDGFEIADVGPGVGIDGIFFAQHGAKVTFVDIVEDNLKLLERVCSLKGIKANYYFIDDFFNYHFKNKFDAFLFIGSMINAPFDFTQKQVSAMVSFLRPGGKIVMLAYPKERYDSLGARDGSEFGKMTDGERTPWAEWYNDDKIKALFGKGFTLEWSRNFGQNGIEFNWFDLTKNDEKAPEILEKGVDHSKSKITTKITAKWETMKGEYLFRIGNLKQAYESFERAIKLNPNLATPHNNLGVYYWENRDFEKSLQYFEKAIEIEPHNPEILTNVIKVLIGLGRTRDAMRLFCDSWKVGIRFSPELIEQIRSGMSQEISVILHREDFPPPAVSIVDLHKRLGFELPLDYPLSSFTKPLNIWKMEVDDAPIFRYIYRNFKPKRHLEFGTWQGQGVLYCLEECNATVWTINLPHGEEKNNGEAAYGLDPSELNRVQEWAKRIGMPIKKSYRTDSLGFIGRYYLKKDMGHRVCQIYCDSRKWDISNYPSGFFDSVLIDGGHAKDIVINDTIKALKLLKKGGLIMWHDFCPPLYGEFDVVRGVIDGVVSIWDGLIQQMEQIFWIYPSWILLGVKK